jgi:type IV pilus assembly protein PilO
MSVIDDLKNLENIDWNDFSSWPIAIKLVGVLAIGIGILFAGYWFIIKGEIEDLDRIQKEELGLRTTFSSKKALAINLPAYQKQMEEMNQTFGSLLRQLPDSTEVPDLLIDITQAGLGRGLSFQLFQPGKENKKGFYAELPVSLRVTGTYHELAQFISDVSALPRIVTIGNISIASVAKSEQLSMSATARTYRYLAAREQGKKGSAGKQGAKPAPAKRARH